MNAAEKLSREIRRVTEIREQYREAGKALGIMVEPAMLMMELALEEVCLASGANDVVRVLRSLKSLEGFE